MASVERWKASAYRQLCLPLLPFTHARSESINADSLNSTSYSSEEGVAAGHSGQFTPMRLPVNTVIHATLVGLEPATFRSLVDCWSDALPVPPTHHGRLIVRVCRKTFNPPLVTNWGLRPLLRQALSGGITPTETALK